MWDGKNLNGKTLMIWREQGLGDEILFMSIINDVIKYVGNNIILETDHRLVNIIQRTFPDILVRKQTFSIHPPLHTVKTDFDFHIPMGELMRFYRSDINQFNQSKPYIKVNDIFKDKFNERLLDYKDKIKIGICWRSGTMDPIRNLDSYSIDKLEVLFNQKEFVFVNLQYDDCEDELLFAEEKFNIKIIRWGDIDLKNDLDDVFALMSELDYVVTVGTAVYEMSGAVGTKTFVPCLKHSWHDLGHNIYPWFNNVKLFKGDNNCVHLMLPEILNEIRNDFCSKK